MDALMMDLPLMLSAFLQHAAEAHGDAEVVSREFDGSLFHYGYADANLRAKKLALALEARGVGAGERVGTLAWNSHRHFELFYGTSGYDRVLHTINPRLHRDELVYIINHCEDAWLFCDRETLPIIEDLAPDLAGVRGYCLLGDADEMPGDTRLPDLVCYEELIGEQDGDLEWPAFDENHASSICYTSGTTGRPKGVVYSHRAMVLATLTLGLRDFLGYAENGRRDVACAIAPMFHGNAWNFPYLAPALGMNLILPGRDYSAGALLELLQGERATIACGVPTIWMLLLERLEKTCGQLPDLKVALSAGSTPPSWLIERYAESYGVDVLNTWGGTECLVGSVGSLKPGDAELPATERFDKLRRSGRAHWGARLRIVDDEGRAVPADGRTPGNLQIRGPFIARGYFRREDASPLRGGWFDTGDVATFDPDGYFQIVDRSKDVIKSGGEWISTVDLENHALAHSDVRQAAVISVTHPRWQERPLLICVRAEGSSVTAEEIRDFLSRRVAKWWLPEDIEFVEAIPLTGTGKIQKTTLRQEMGYRGYDVIRR